MVRPGGPYAGLTVVDRTGSTNADLRAAALDGTVLYCGAADGWAGAPGAGVGFRRRVAVST